MTSKRTLTKIIEAIERGYSYKARIGGYYYNISYNSDIDVIETIPVGTGSAADSGVEYNNYKYINGGMVYRKAVDLVKEVHDILRSRSEGYSKDMVDMEFEDVHGDMETHRVETGNLGRIEAYRCPLCDQWCLQWKGCSSGHMAISPL